MQCRRPGFDPWVGNIPWRKKWQPTPTLLPGKSHGQRSLVGFSSWGCKELGTTEQLTRTHTRTLIGSSAGPESVCSTGDLGSIPQLGRSPGEGIGYPLQYSWAFLVDQMVKNLPTVHGVAKSRTLLSNKHIFYTQTHPPLPKPTQRQA